MTMLFSRALVLPFLLATQSANGLRTLAFFSRSDLIRMAENEDIQVPPREYGYRQEPLAWPELVQIINVEQNLAKLSRSVIQQKVYIIYRRELLKEWKVNDPYANKRKTSYHCSLTRLVGVRSHPCLQV